MEQNSIYFMAGDRKKVLVNRDRDQIFYRSLKFAKQTCNPFLTLS